MPTHKSDLTRLNVTQLAGLVKCKPHVMRRRLDGLEPAQTTGRELLYNSADALSRYFVGESLNLTRERARLARAQAEREELRHAKEIGEVVDGGALDRSLIALSTAASGRMQNIAPRIAPELAAESTAAGCQKIVADAVYEALFDLSEQGRLAGERLEAELRRRERSKSKRGRK